ncbi:hypothetical protein ACFFX0_25270 [Citricoccus parietis]|uniref:Uncharacterized protein n=1 Tax=Citricoccus parietis TaxID=592307 RepID=A0ABV5G5V1_9MICC
MLVLPTPGSRSATSAKTGSEKVIAGVAPSFAVEDGIGPAGTLDGPLSVHIDTHRCRRVRTGGIRAKERPWSSRKCSRTRFYLRPRRDHGPQPSSGRPTLNKSSRLRSR